MAKNMPATSKRKQVDKTQAMMLSFVIGASIITTFSLVAAKSFYSKARYFNKVAGLKEKAVNQLKTNKQAVSSLVSSYQTFAAQNPNILGGSSTGSGAMDGDNGRLVLDALPSKYDFPALATSLEKMLAGYQLNSISGSDDSTNQDKATAAQTVEIPFSLNVSTDYAGTNKLIETFEKSIRPFQITKLSLSGTNSNLAVSINAKTFFQPQKDLTIQSEVVK